jgi:thiol-disulfide isomerase/thioredoxin
MPVNDVKVGAKIPNFSLADINDSTRSYSRQALHGKFYLIDFWATWCLPCIGEIPYLQRAYSKYHSKGLEILSISSDSRRGDVMQFRSKKFSMPWNHVWLSPANLRRVHDDFAVTGIPKPILVDREGIIVALGPDLRGDSLQRVLSKFLGR